MCGLAGILTGDGRVPYTTVLNRLYRRHANESRVRSQILNAIRRSFFGAIGQLYPKLDRAPRFLRAKARAYGGAGCSRVEQRLSLQAMVDAYMQTCEPALPRSAKGTN